MGCKGNSRDILPYETTPEIITGRQQGMHSFVGERELIERGHQMEGFLCTDQRKSQLCPCDIEERECGVGDSVNTTRNTTGCRSHRNYQNGDSVVKKPMNLSVYDGEDRDREAGDSVNSTMLFEVLQVVQVVGVAEAVRTAIRLRKKTMNLCASDSEDRERGVGAM